MTVGHGAEAIVETDVWLGRSVLAKRRAAKPYRHPELDARLRDERTRDEANLLIAARAAGVPVPVVYDADRAGATLRLQRIEGPPLRELLDDDPDAVAEGRMAALGRILARLHDAGLTHGDLTTSNILVPGGRDARPEDLVLIDFGLGQFTPEAEDRAVDLHVVEEAMEATHARSQRLMDALLAAYDASGREATLRRLEAVRERGRNRAAI